MSSLNLPIWITLNNILAELCDTKILIQIGDLLRGIKGYEPHHIKSTSIKLLINLKPEIYHQEYIKIIENRSLYKINFSIYQGKIKHMKFLKDGRRVATNNLDFEETKLDTSLEE